MYSFQHDGIGHDENESDEHSAEGAELSVKIYASCGHKRSLYGEKRNPRGEDDTVNGDEEIGQMIVIDRCEEEGTRESEEYRGDDQQRHEWEERLFQPEARGSRCERGRIEFGGCHGAVAFPGVFRGRLFGES